MGSAPRAVVTSLGVCLGIACGRHPFADPIDGGGGGGAGADAAVAPTAPLHLGFAASDFLASGVGAVSCVGACPQVTAGRPGRGEAALFDGSGGLEVTGLEASSPPAFTAALWVRLDTTSFVEPMSLFSRAFDPIGTSNNSFELYLQPGPTLYMDTVTMDSFGNLNVNGLRATPEVGRWTHVAMTFDERARRLYVDGELRLADERGAIRYDTSPLLLGLDRDLGAVVNHLVGALDDVMLFERALGPAEVAALVAP